MRQTKRATVRERLHIFNCCLCHPPPPKIIRNMETKVLSSGFKYQNLPEGYVRPESERPRLSEVSECKNIPVINLASENRAETVQQVGDACKSYGFFQVINHGVSTEAVEKMLGTATEFFSLPVEEKMKLYSDDPSKTMRLSTSFNVNKEKVHNWRDYLRLHCYPLEKYVPEWPSNPSSFKYVNSLSLLLLCLLLSEISFTHQWLHFSFGKGGADCLPLSRGMVVTDIVSKYSVEVRELGFRLQELISESLGLEKDYIKCTLGEQGQHMAVNFYPPCPQPELTYGLPGHTDPNALTILLQDLGVAGLQVLKDGKWVAVNPHPNAFVINLGDQLQALSNGIYKSVWHRAITNTDRARLSVASFLCPQDDALISPAKALTDDVLQPFIGATRTQSIIRSFGLGT
ncbi:2-oxoglutarate and Fe(II)-dependent oxygenase superfamily protein [Prunus dulcis]|uniref:2-oxoglutarate and Fe(II)-dependent oxygenase superfamily protein n=1 Tax=Prunus dulcis TaxID=3755 RepID=A0A4Y1R2U2_PRUDU|nr:2-oxoglutarate and Fe(II)-dependent oxygenase superfamily protein [Prunus dulcis]